MFRLAENIRSRGFMVKLVKNEQFPDISADNVHFFYDKSYETFFQNDPAQGKIGGCTRLRKGFLSGLNQFMIKHSLKNISQSLSCGDSVDLCLTKRRSLAETKHDISTVSRAASFSDIVEDNGNASIVTGFMEFVAGGEKLSMYDTDFDIKEALGNDYFVLFLKNMKIEMCRSGNRLIIIGKKNDDCLGVLLDSMPFMKKFNFKKVKELIILRNRMPWIVNTIDKGLLLINDYSYFNVSVKLEPEWFDKVGKHICADVRR